MSITQESEPGSSIPEAALSSFEERKWERESAFRSEELELRRREQERLASEFQLKKEETERSRWFNPLVIAIVAAAFAAVGNAAVTYLSGRYQRELEKSKSDAEIALETIKAESTRILEVIKTGNPDKAATNLRFLIDAGLIVTPQQVARLSHYLSTRQAGQGVALASTNSAQVNSCSHATSTSSIGWMQQHGRVLGIDISRLNTGLDFVEMHKHGVEFAYVKASEGSGFQDPSYLANAAAAQRAGLLIGLYHHFTSANLVEQFANFSAALNKVQWTLPPALDIESSPDDDGAMQLETGSALFDRVRPFLSATLSRFKVQPVVYLGTRKAELLHGTAITAFPLWIAQYGDALEGPRVPSGWAKDTFWQVTDCGSDDPSLAAIDLDFFNGSVRELQNLRTVH